MIWPGLVVTAGAVRTPRSATYSWRKADTTAARAEVLGVSLALTGLLSLLLSLAGWIAIETALSDFDSDTRTAARAYLLSIPLAVLQGVGGGILLAGDRVGPFWGTRLVGALFYLALLVMLAAIGTVTVPGTVVAVLLSQAAATIAMAFWIRRDVALPRPRWNGALCRQIIVFGGKTNLVGMPYALNVRLDQLLM